MSGEKILIVSDSIPRNKKGRFKKGYKLKKDYRNHSHKYSYIENNSLYYGLWNLGYSDKEISKFTNHPKSTISNWRWRRGLNPNYDIDKNRNKKGRFIKGCNVWNDGIVWNEMKGKNNPAWCGGKSIKQYPQEFSEKLKRKIRKRDKYTCQECKYTEKQLGYNLSIHHIDYNKNNNNPNNLVSLCRGCHAKTNWNRDNWINYYTNKITGGDL